MVIQTIAADDRVQGLRARLAEDARGVVHATGLWGSSAPMVTAAVAAPHPRPCLYITAHAEEADHARDDLELFIEKACALFPAWETLPGEGAAAGEIEAERLRLCTQLIQISSGSASPARPNVIVAPILALMQPVPTPARLERNTLRLTVGRTSGHSAESVVAWAVDRGFDRLDLVESPGDVARRGDIVDLFAPGETLPYRIQFLDDEIESIRRFDVSTQRSAESLTNIAIAATRSAAPDDTGEQTSFLAYLPPDTLLVLDDPPAIQEAGLVLAKRLDRPDRLFGVTDVLAAIQPFAQLHLSRFGGTATAGEEVFEFGVTSCSRFEGDSADAVTELCHTSRDHQIFVYCDNDGERRRLHEMITEQDPQALGSIQLLIGVMRDGFEWTHAKTVVVPHHQLFHRQRQRRRIRRLQAARPIDTWTDLKPGDIVAHITHGIALYRGLRKIRKSETGQQEEFLTLEFADKATVHVPTSQIDLVQKYIGVGGRRPPLSKLGGKRWNKTKEQVAEAVSELAEALLRIQAVRRARPGTAYPPDTEWQREFEAAFLYEETEDQLSVAGEIRGDLTKPLPMDRLVCGDVGYGKTELAMRASFKVVEYGRQVAVLVPTTVLAEQHYVTFTERMAEYPFSIAVLSRFRTAAEQKQIVQRLKKGQVDIVIGTHRLLSDDITFADLGLVIIDEEQRFGVESKERLKAMRETVDVLTLTATPIPRTLHMSLVGIRDISSLQTPPIDRRAIATQVRPFDESLIRDAILREMNRDGQVYFVHNFVQSIAAMADTVRRIVPEARVIYGHGQMKGRELDGVMHKFVERKADVLVATTIIESGIDIPTVNTIFINRAERFGLADLHQLRGRVGRSSHRAYCYLLLSPGRPPAGKAAKRLKTIEEFSELGAGFRIAMRDLEIRGAGNLLGRDQSGHIAAVGYDLYCRLLDQCVRRLKNEPEPDATPVQVDLDVDAHIPPHYIRADRSRLEVYRRIVGCRTAEDLTQLEADLVDAFGAAPTPVDRLLQLAEIRVHARRFGVVSISLRPPDVVFGVELLSAAESLFTDAPGTVRIPDQRTVYLRLPPNYLEPASLLTVLRHMLIRATERMEVIP